jgi:hypothetical protein
MRFWPIGWTALEFLGRPLRSFFDLRRRIREHMLNFEVAMARPPYFPGDDSSHKRHSELRRMDEAISALRGLSAELVAFGDSEPVAAPVLRCLGFRPALAGRALSDFTAKRSSPKAREVMQALRLPIG